MNILKREFSRREKIFLLAGGVLIALFAMKILFIPFMEKRQEVVDSLALKRELLVRTKRAITMKPQMEVKHKALVETVKNLETSLLAAKTPTLASAELQSLMKAIAQRSGVQIKSIKTLKAEEMGEYAKVQAEVTLYADIRSLLDFLYNIEDDGKALIVTRMDVVLQNDRGGPRLQSTLRISAGGYGSGGLSLDKRG